MKSTVALFFTTVFLSLLGSLSHRTSADDLDVRKLLPDTTAVYMAANSVESVLNHPFIKSLQSSGPFKKLMRLPDARKLNAGLVFFEFAVGDKLESVLKSLTSGGVHVAVDKKSEGAVLLANTESQEWIEEYLLKLVKLARADAKSKNQPDPIREADYRGVHGYEFQKLMVGNIGSVLIVTNKGELGKSIIDRHLDSTSDHLLNKPLFQHAWNGETPQPEATESSVKVFVDIDMLRQAGVAKDLLMGKAKDFGAELILGGVLASLNKTSFAMGELFLSDDKISVDFRIPHEKAWTEESRAFFVGPNGLGHATTLVDGASLMANVSTYRNLSELWLRAGDLFDEKVNDQLAQADSTLTTLFSGKDFGTDILGAIEPQIELIASEQQFDSDLVPAIQLPSFGLVAKLKNPMMRKDLKRMFQTFIGFLNFTGAMNGNAQLDLDSETIDARQIHTASYIKESDKQYENGLPIQFNFSPTLAFDGDLVIFTSANSLAKKVSTNVKQGSLGKAPLDNTRMTVDFAEIKRILESNRKQLVSQNMLEKGHSKGEAEKEIDTLLSIMSLLRSGMGSLRFDDFVRFTLELEIISDR
ncbi:MAG: hypothetical protein NTY15_16840 [Planctomycetota bacterium]|nr:hypothetical protein [Planctomycetota bacterium]